MDLKYAQNVEMNFRKVTLISFTDNRTKDKYNFSCKECMGYEFTRPEAREGYRMCRVCGKELPLTSEYFSNSKKSKGGLVRRCKVCESIHSGQYYAENRESTIMTSTKYRLAHKDAYLEYGRKYRRSDPEKILTKQREYRRLNPEKCRINNHGRRSKIRNLPHTFTARQCGRNKT